MRAQVRGAVVAAVLGCVLIGAPAGYAAFPGENGKIAFVSNRDGGTSDIWTMNADGTGLTQLTNTPQNDGGPRWSADGRRIAFERDYRDANNVLHQEVWTMNADGSGQTFVTVGGFPSWSPDGKKIVFGRIGRDTEGGGIFVNDGVSETKIAPGLRDDVRPDWSSDGLKVVYTVSLTSDDIYSVNADGTGNTRLTTTFVDYGGTWSPDATKIAFQHRDSNGRNDIWRMNPDGSGRTQLTSSPENESLPAWSPDGQKIVAGYQDGSGQQDIVVMNADGTDIAHLTNDPEIDQDPDWQPVPDATYARPKGATPVRTSLVPAYRPCTAPNDTHGVPLAFPSCNPPALASDYLTIGTGSIGSIRTDVVPGNPATPANEADVRLAISVTDVLDKTTLADYGGQLQASLPVRITDKDNAPSVGGPNRSGTVSDASFPATVPCTPTADPAIGSSCALVTTANSVMPGAVKEGNRSIWALDGVLVFDGGADGLASTAGNTLFERQGVFVP